MSETVRILYMEDNEGISRLLQKRLSRRGYMIDTAPNGETGLEMCASQHFDAIILDYNMPGLNGLQVMQRLADRGTMPPTIMLTGSGNERIAVEALKLGAFDYVIKDIDGVYLDLLPAVIEQALKNQQLLEDKRRAEEALQESEERFRMLFEHAPDPYFINDLAGNMIDCNHAVETLLGLDRNSLIGKNIPETQLITPDQIKKIADSFPLRQSEAPEVTITRPDGATVIIALSIIPVQAKGETQILGIGHDITWRKQAETQMKDHIEQLETLHRIDDELTRRLELHYVQTMALETMMHLSGADAGSIELINEAEGMEIHSIGYPEELLPHNFLDKPSVAARVAQRHEAEWIKDVADDPDYFVVLADTCSQITIPLISQNRLMGIVNLETSQPDCFNDEKFEFLKLIAARIAVAIDNAELYDTSQKHLLELQSLYERISKLEQLKTDMIRIASHDLRGPLAAVTTGIYLLQKLLAGQLSEQQEKQFTAMDRAAKQMEAITTDFLSLERIEEITQGDFNGQDFSLRDLVQSVYESYQLQTEEKSQGYEFSLPEMPFLVRGDKAELQQAIGNIIGNAVKYTPPEGTIEVILRRQSMMARFEVVDTGYGIPPEQQEKLFQPFFRVQMTETASIDGTGLGLYLVKKIVERNGGKIIFHSEHGRGSRFGFELPLLAE
jgi:PAS domain S-box-containing protein